MIKIENTEVWGFNGAIHGVRNPKNSWVRSDSYQTDYINDGKNGFVIGANDLKLCQSLIKAGPEHSKFMRFIHVHADLTLPRFVWAEVDTYKFIEKNSQSTMHKLLDTKEPITAEMFESDYHESELIDMIINRLEYLRNLYQEIRKEDTSDKSDKLNSILLRAKIILPESYLQLRTIDTNYAELRNMYFQRRYHRLPQWHEICDWIRSLPYAKELIVYEGAMNDGDSER